MRNIHCNGRILGILIISQINDIVIRFEGLRETCARNLQALLASMSDCYRWQAGMLLRRPSDMCGITACTTSGRCFKRMKQHLRLSDVVVLNHVVVG